MSDVQQATPQGQVAPAPVSTGQAQVSAPFYSFKGTDGKEESYQTKDDLDKAFKESFFRTKDYTQKTQTLSEFRKQVEKEREEFKKQREDLERKAREYSDFDWLIKNRPDVYRKLQTYASAPQSPDVAVERAQKYADGKVGELQKKLEDLESWRQEQLLQQQRSELMGKLRTEYPDYPDDNSVNEILEELGSGNLENVLRFIYHAHKGRQNPLQVERKLAEAQKRKAEGKLMPSAGSAVEPKKAFKNLDEAAEEAKRMLGG